MISGLSTDELKWITKESELGNCVELDPNVLSTLEWTDETPN